ncbi:MAG: hypothetical protein QOJ57_1333 [Thermoleophilaceae bacterium]|nr:hypothetical protein [Thermoleophilaceae bacterium]
MVKQGPIPAFIHSLIEYIAGVALIAAPLLLDYKSGAATAASIILGVLVLFLVATTTSTMSLINQVPLSMHIVFDYVIAAVMIAAPFLFGFSGKSTPTAVFIAGGVVWLLLSIGTRYRKEEVPARGEPKRRRGARGLPREGGERGGAAAVEAAEPADAAEPAEPVSEERPSRVRPSADAVPDDSIPEFEPPPRGPRAE